MFVNNIQYMINFTVAFLLAVSLYFQFALQETTGVVTLQDVGWDLANKKTSLIAQISPFLMTVQVL